MSDLESAGQGGILNNLPPLIAALGRDAKLSGALTLLAISASLIHKNLPVLLRLIDEAPDA